jgi:hypothetical protein
MRESKNVGCQPTWSNGIHLGNGIHLSTRRLPHPVDGIEGILDVVAVPDLGGGRVVGVRGLDVLRSEAKATDEGHAQLFHHPAGGAVVLVGGRDDAPDAPLGKASVDQGAGALGGIAFTPGGFAQAVAEDDLGGNVFCRTKAKPPLAFAMAAQKPNPGQRAL